LFAAGLAAVLVLALGAAVAGGKPAAEGEPLKLAAADGTGTVEATIRRDSKGIPHILADDFEGIGFGYGFAFAEDNICTIAESYVTVRGERSRYFGPGGSYEQRGNGFTANNLNSDFFYQRIIDEGTVEEMVNQPPPDGPLPEVLEGVRGYVAGYNKYLADTGVDNLTDPRCSGAAWVKPITEMDAYRRFYQLALLASGTVAIDGIASQKTPGTIGTGIPLDISGIANGLQDALAGLRGAGSNAYGLGKEATDNGKGIVLANPHFPWDGSERFYQSHLTIPGEVNVSGASLFGVPLVLIGHTDNMAWSHTVSTAYRFTPFQETVNPLDPTQYFYDGQLRNMEEDVVTVEGDPGTDADDVTRTLYSTHHGPVVDSLAGIPLPWTPVTAFTMGDVNAGNFRYLNHFIETNRAQSVRRLDEIEATYQGIPWVNTIAADSTGEAYYADIGAIPNVPNSKANSLICASPLGLATMQLLGLPILNGALSGCEWNDDPDAVAPGIFGYDNLPKIFRDDYVTNSNDSYWLSNPEHPLEGYARIIGDERMPRTLRTRIGLKMVIERFGNGPNSPATDPLGRQDVQDLVFGNRQYAAELWRDQLVQVCQSAPGGQLAGTGGPVNVTEACPILASWDLKENLDSEGAILFRRFATHALGSPLPVGLPLPTGDLTVFSNPFNFGDPVNTPSGLNTVSPKVTAALADAVSDLRNAGIPLDAPLGEWQYEKRGDERVPIHGGNGDPHGQFNAIGATWSGSGPEPGFTNIPHGSSFVMVTQFDDSACGMDDRSILTFSQSENPNSPHYGDQTRMFSQKEWVSPASCEAELATEPDLDTTVIEGCLPAGCGPDDEEPPGPGPGPDPSGPGVADGCVNELRGTAAGERLRGTSGRDRIVGFRGTDSIDGLGAADCLFGGRGADRVAGGPGDDLVRGGGAADRVIGGPGRDRIVGGPGNDVIRAKDGARDVVRCGGGVDRVKADRADRLKACE
jgi:acyl-homoserine-lactone acylase